MTTSLSSEYAEMVKLSYIEPYLPDSDHPKLFSVKDDALGWAMTVDSVSHHLHYLDDFFFAGLQDPSQCSKTLCMLQLCNSKNLSVTV